MQDIEFLYLTRADVWATGMNMAMVMDAVEDSFRLHHTGQTILPHKVVLDLGERERGRGNAMPAYVGGEYDVFGIKWIAGFPGNPVQHGLPRATGFFILNDSWKGIPLAIMDCTWLSALLLWCSTSSVVTTSETGNPPPRAFPSTSISGTYSSC